jgi:ribosome-associated toxin RatA of RatAB toxin-antitoxin module
MHVREWEMMGRVQYYTVLFIFMCVSAVSAKDTDYEWHPIKEKNGIKVYASKTPDSDFTTYKATGIIDRPWEALFEVLLDVPGYSSWMPGCRKSSMVKMIQEDPVKGNFVIHLVWDAIWPVKNRDLVVEVNSLHDWENDHVEVVLNDTILYPVPLESGLVRVKKFYARFDFNYIDKTHTEVSFVTMIDPGGVVPSGVADIQTVEVAYDTLKALGERAKDPKYFKQAIMDYF